VLQAGTLLTLLEVGGWLPHFALRAVFSDVSINRRPRCVSELRFDPIVTRRKLGFGWSSALENDPDPSLTLELRTSIPRFVPMMATFSPHSSPHLLLLSGKSKKRRGLLS